MEVHALQYAAQADSTQAVHTGCTNFISKDVLEEQYS